MEQDIMASENAAERGPSDERKQDDGLDSVTSPSQQNGPSLFHDGPELIRDNHC
jgi:hypothetical protein